MIGLFLLIAFFVWGIHREKKHPPTSEEKRRYKKYLETGNFDYLS